MISTSILHHAHPAGTTTQAFATTVTATNHLQFASVLQQLDQSAQQPALQPTLRLEQSLLNQPASEVNNSAAGIQSKASPTIIPSTIQVLPVQSGTNAPLAPLGIGPQPFQHARPEQAVIPSIMQILPASAGISIPFIPTVVGPQLFQHANTSNPAAMILNSSTILWRPGIPNKDTRIQATGHRPKL